MSSFSVTLLCSLLHIFLLLIFWTNGEIRLKPYLEQITSSGDLIIFQCKVFKYDRKFSVHFHCPLRDEQIDDRCYEDCHPLEEKLFDINCTKEIKNGNAIFRFKAKKSTLPSGSYKCSFRGNASHFINHIQDEKENFTEVTEITSTKKPSIVTIISTYSTTSKIYKERISLQISRKEIVYLLLALLTLSIILNVIFFIRCLITRHISYNEELLKFSPTNNSLAACLCIDRNGFANYHKGREDIYDNIRDILPDSDTTKSKSSSGHESQNILISPTSSQLTRSLTFPFRQSILVHTPTDQMAMTPLNMQPYMMPYILEDGQCVMGPVLNHRLSFHGLYDDVPEDTASNMSIRPFASTGSLNHRPKRFHSSQTKASPLPEENPSTSPPFTNLNSQTDEGVGFIGNDISSTYDLNSSEGTYISGKGSDSFRDPVRSAKLEMSREMMAKADTLLREAHNLLKQS